MSDGKRYQHHPHLSSEVATASFFQTKAKAVALSSSVLATQILARFRDEASGRGTRGNWRGPERRCAVRAGAT